MVTGETKKKKNSLPSHVEAVALDPGVPDSIRDTLLYNGVGPLGLIVNSGAAGLSLVSSLIKRFEPKFLKNIPVLDKAFHNSQTTMHADTFINAFVSLLAGLSGQWLIAAMGIVSAYGNVPELEGIRHHDNKDYMKNAGITKLIFRREDFWNGLNYTLAVCLIGGTSVATMMIVPFIALATVVGIKNARNHLPERTNHPKMMVAAAFLAVGIPTLFTGGLLMGLSSVIGAVAFAANEVHVTPGGLKQVIKDCFTLDNYKYGFIPFAKSGFGLKKLLSNPKLIGIAANNAAAGSLQTVKGGLNSAKTGFGAKKLAKSVGRKSNNTPPKDNEIAAIGQLTKEGIYIGRLKDKDGVERDYFAAPEDAKDSQGKRLSLNFNDAAKYAEDSKALGHSDWVVPTSLRNKYDKENVAPDVLGAIFNSKSTGAFKGTFEETGRNAAWYWSSTTKPHCEKDQNSATIQRFSRGRHSYGYKKDKLSVRLVRSLDVSIQQTVCT